MNQIRFIAILVSFIAGLVGTTLTSWGTSPSAAPEKYAKFFNGLSNQQIVYWSQGGGAILEALQRTIFSQLEAWSGIKVRGEYFCCGLAKLQAQQEARDPKWDVLEFGDGAEFAQAIQKGWLEKLPDDFPFSELEPGTYNEYGLIKERFAAVLAWNTKTWPLSGPHPTTITDLFDTQRFPGKRCLLKSPSFGGNFEAALLADGIDPAKLYPLDIDRALKKLDTIKKDIVWWTSGDQSTQYLMTGECSIGIAFNGRPYSRVVKENAPLSISWERAILLNGWNGIQKGTQHKNAAVAYFACQVLCRDAIEAYVKEIAYAPPIKGIYESLDPTVKPWVASGPNIKTGIPQDDQYYADHTVDITQKWNQWLQK
jgi:putative spermidine/putrescine transport system substrate-binding protein